MRRFGFIGSIMAVAILIIATEYIYGQNLQLIGTGGIPSYINVSDIEFSGNYIYLSTISSGLLVIDVSDPVNPTQVGHLGGPDLFSPGNIFVDGNRLYAISTITTNSDVSIVDISTPSNPQIIGVYSDTLTPLDIWVEGSYVYLTSFSQNIYSNIPFISVIDFSDPANPILVSTQPCRRSGLHITVSADYAYLAEGQFMEIFDVSTPNNITMVFRDSSYGANDLIKRNSYLFALSNSTSIFNISNPTNPALAGTSPIGGYSIKISGDYAYSLVGGSFNSPINVLDISDLSTPLWAAKVTIVYPNYPQVISARNDTLYVAGNSYFGIYRLSGQAKGCLEGVVRDSINNLPVENAIVELVQNGFVDTTDLSGRFLFSNIYNLAYTLTVNCPGYRSRTDTSLIVIPNDTISCNIALGRMPWVDVSPYSVISPPKRVKADSTYALQARVRNNGIDTISCDLICETYIYDWPIPLFVDTAAIESIPPATTTIVTLAESLSVFPDTMYKIVCFTVLPGDENHSNDTLVYYCSSETTQFEVWYGNPDGSPVIASVGDLFYVDIYVRTRPDVYVANILLNLGVNDIYIDTLLSRQSPDGNPYHRYGKYYSPITEWDDASFLNPSYSPPNLPGWSAESFMGFADLGGGPNPWLNSVIPIKILSMAMRATFDTSLFGDTVDAFGTGLAQLGEFTVASEAGDTVGGSGFHVTEHFSRLVFRPGYSYIPGDMNGDRQRIAADATYGVRFLKGLGAPPPDSCYIDTGNTWLYMAADVNGNCEFRGSDIVRLVAYFKSTAGLSYCHFFPPTQTRR